MNYELIIGSLALVTSIGGFVFTIYKTRQLNQEKRETYYFKLLSKVQKLVIELKSIEDKIHAFIKEEESEKDERSIAFIIVTKELLKSFENFKAVVNKDYILIKEQKDTLNRSRLYKINLSLKTKEAEIKRMYKKYEHNVNVFMRIKGCDRVNESKL